MWFFLSFENISRQPIWNLAGQQNFVVFLSDSYVISATNKLMKLQPKCVANSVEDVEFSKNTSKNQSNSNSVSCFSFLLLSILPNFQYTLWRMWTLKFITCDHLTYIKTSFSFPVFLPVNSVLKKLGGQKGIWLMNISILLYRSFWKLSKLLMPLILKWNLLKRSTLRVGIIKQNRKQHCW